MEASVAVELPIHSHASSPGRSHVGAITARVLQMQAFARTGLDLPHRGGLLSLEWHGRSAGSKSRRCRYRGIDCRLFPVAESFPVAAPPGSPGDELVAGRAVYARRLGDVVAI
jgi:hypothetical protein